MIEICNHNINLFIFVSKREKKNGKINLDNFFLDIF